MKKKELNNIIKIFEGFSGYGGGSFALRNISRKHKKIKYNVVGCSEIDKYADELYSYVNQNDTNRKLVV